MADDSDLLLAVAALQQGQIDVDAFAQLLEQYNSEGGSLSALLAERGVCLESAMLHLQALPQGFALASKPDPFPSSDTSFESDSFSTVNDEEDHEGSTIRALSTPPFGSVEGDDSVRTVSEVPGRYESLEEYARGGMGRIIRVRDLFLDREIALKELLPGPRIRGMGREVQSSPSARARRLFLDEARTTGRLQHPSIVPVHEIGQRPDGTVYYTMKLVKGRPLSQAIRAAEGLGDRLALLPHFLDVCHAIAYAHSQGVIHRDIKPRNIMIGEFAETVVIDWGLALDMRACNSDPASLTGRLKEASAHSPYADAMGTPAYMAPEQALGDHQQVNERSDVYSLGAVLYKLLTGKTPFRGDKPDAVMHQVVHDAPRPVSELEPGVPPELAAVCERAMAKNPAARFPSVLALAEEIERFQAGAMLRSYRYNVKDRLARWLRRNQPLVASGAAAIVALFLLTLYSYIQIVQQKNEAEIARLEAEAATQHARMGLAEARRAQQQSDTSREDAIAARLASERSLYSAYVSLAQNHMAQGNFGRAISLLAECSPEHRNWEWGNLQFACNQDYHTFPIPAAGVRVEARGRPAAAFNTSSRTLLIQQSDGVYHAQDMHTGDLTHVIEGHNLNHYLEPFYSDGNRYLGMIDNDSCLVLDPITFERIHMFPLQQHWQWRAQFSDDERRIAVRTQVNVISVYDLETGNAVNSLTVMPTFNLAAISGAGELLAVFSASGGSGTEGSLRLLDVADGHTVATWEDAQVKQLLFARQDSALLALADDGMRVYLPEASGAPVLLEDTAGAQVAVWSADGTQLAIGMADGRVRVMEWPGRQWTRAFAGHAGAVTALAFDEGGERLASAGEDHLVQVWEGESRTAKYRFEGHSEAVQRLAFHQSEPMLYSASVWRAKLWSLDRREGPSVLGEQVRTAASDAAGRQLFTADASGNVLQHELASGAVRTVYTPESRVGVVEPLLNYGGSRLLLTAEDRFELIDLAGEQAILERETGGALGHAAAFSPDGTRLAIMYSVGATGQPVIDVYESETGSLMTSIRPFLTKDTEQYYYASLTFASDNQRLAVAVDEQVAMFHLNEPKLQEQLPTQPVAALVRKCLAFDKADSRLAVGGYGSGILLMDLAGQGPPRQLTGHSQPVTALCFTGDGERLVSGGADGLVKVWDTASGQELVNWRVFDTPVKFVLFAGECALVTGDGTEGAHIATALPWRDSELPGDELVPVQDRIEATKTLDPRVNTSWGRCQSQMRHIMRERRAQAGAISTDAGNAEWSCEAGGDLQWLADPAAPSCSVHGPLWNAPMMLDLMKEVETLIRNGNDEAARAPAQWLASAVRENSLDPTIRGWLKTGRAGAAHGVCQVLAEGEGPSTAEFHQLAGDAAFAANDIAAAVEHYRKLPDRLQIHTPQLHQALIRRRAAGDLELAYSLLTQRLAESLPDEADRITLGLVDLTRDPVDEASRSALERLVNVDTDGWKSLPWYHDFDSACAAAVASGKPIYLELDTPTAHTSQWLHQRIYSHPVVFEKLAASFVLCRLMAEQVPDLVTRYTVQHFPALLVLDDEGDVILADFEFSSPNAIREIVPPPIPAGRVMEWRVTGLQPYVNIAHESSEIPESVRPLIEEIRSGACSDWYTVAPNIYRQELRFVDVSEPSSAGTFYAWTRFEISEAGSAKFVARFSQKFRCWLDSEYVGGNYSEDLVVHTLEERFDLEPGQHEVLVELQGTARHLHCMLDIEPMGSARVTTAEMPACQEIKSIFRLSGQQSVVASQREAGVTRARVKASDVLARWRENYLQYLAVLNPRPYPDTGPVRGIKADRVGEIPMLVSLGLKDGDIITGVNGIRLSDVSDWREMSRNLEGQREYRIELLRNEGTHVIVIEVEY